MSSTTFFDAAVLNKVFRDINFEIDALFLALFVADPGKAGSLGFEVAAPEYVRQAVTFSVAWVNEADVLFPLATSSWGTITHAGITNNATGSYLLGYGALSPSLVIVNQKRLRVPAGSLTLSFA